jgi:hypothetical protein
VVQGIGEKKLTQLAWGRKRTRRYVPLRWGGEGGLGRIGLEGKKAAGGKRGREGEMGQGGREGAGPVLGCGKERGRGQGLGRREEKSREVARVFHLF